LTEGQPDELDDLVNAEPPLWQTIRAVLEGELAAGAFPPGTPLPAEKHLAARFGCAIGTVRRAVDELVAARALVRRQGRGTFVPDHGPDRTLFHFFHIEAADGRREHPQTELLDFASPVEAPPEVALPLGLPTGAPMHRARNLQRLQGRPVMLEELWLPAALFPALDQAGFAGREGTVYGLFQKRFGFSVVRTEERLRAERPGPDMVALLELPPGEPVLRIHRIAYAIGDKPVEVRFGYVNTAAHEYRASLV
jgi:GntR family transcriptional regulator